MAQGRQAEDAATTVSLLGTLLGQPGLGAEVEKSQVSHGLVLPGGPSAFPPLRTLGL